MDLSWVPGAVIGSAALVVSVLGYRRSGRADSADNEFRNVKWSYRLSRNHDGEAVFHLQNVGSTSARLQRLEVTHPGAVSMAPISISVQREFQIKAGAEEAFPMGVQIEPVDELYISAFELTNFRFRVDWKSPLGTLEAYEYRSVLDSNDARGQAPEI